MSFLARRAFRTAGRPSQLRAYSAIKAGQSPEAIGQAKAAFLAEQQAIINHAVGEILAYPVARTLLNGLTV